MGENGVLAIHLHPIHHGPQIFPSFSCVCQDEYRVLNQMFHHISAGMLSGILSHQIIGMLIVVKRVLHEPLLKHAGKKPGNHGDLRAGIGEMVLRPLNGSVVRSR